MSSANFAAALGYVAKRFIGRTEKAAFGRHVAEAEMGMNLPPSDRVCVCFGLENSAFKGNTLCLADEAEQGYVPATRIATLSQLDHGAPQVDKV